MRAVVHDRYGPPEVLRVENVERPVPEADHILVRVQATTVNRTDCGFRSAELCVSRALTGSPPAQAEDFGMELAGEVEAVGASVTRFHVGDHVFGVIGSGAHAELVCVRDSAAVAHKPAGMTFEEAAAVCDGACSALAWLRTADLREGRSILVYGARDRSEAPPCSWRGTSGPTSPALCDTKKLEKLVEAGEYRAVIDRHYPLEDVVEATRYVETGQKTGNVVLTLDGAAR